MVFSDIFLICHKHFVFLTFSHVMNTARLYEFAKILYFSPGIQLSAAVDSASSFDFANLSPNVDA